MSPNGRGRSAKPDRPGQAAPLADRSATFIGSFPDPATPLDPALPEIAVLGRSNVGKSSLLNALLGRRGIARVSATPGKTQLMNVFRLPDFYLVDLPGYGWARASATARRGFRQLLEGYLTGRPRLAGVIWLLDIRHPPSTDDLAARELLAQTGRPCLTVLTKGDKLPRMRRALALQARAEELDLPPDDLLVTSSRTGEGIAELGESIRAAIAG